MRVHPSAQSPWLARALTVLGFLAAMAAIDSAGCVHAQKRPMRSS